MSDPVVAAWGAYVHVPWCRARCPYCAFAVVPGAAPPDAEPFVDRVLWERDRWQTAFAGVPTTLFLGGGTPSRLPPRALTRLVQGLGGDAIGEVSAEVNPEDIDERWLAAALAAGVTRLSIGVQSFLPAVAGRLGRAHTTRQARAACRRIAEAGFRSWSLDLIFAVPGQRLQDLDDDLSTALDLGAPHASVYGLTFEDGTRFHRARARGRMKEVDEDAWRAMYDRVVERLEAGGLPRYEVSNFARPDHRCRHNRLYWTDRPYLGLGPSAHGYAPDGERWANVTDLAGWLLAEDPIATRERPDAAARASDLLISGLRSVEGVSIHSVRSTGLEPDPATVDGLRAAGMLLPTRDTLTLAHSGFPLADAVVGRLISALRAAQSQ